MKNEQYWKYDALGVMEERFKGDRQGSSFSKRFVYDRAIEALHVLNAAPLGEGCLTSAIAFTHGDRALHELHIDSSFTDGSDLDGLARNLAQKYGQLTETLTTIKLTPNKFLEFINKYPWVWCKMICNEEFGHMIAISNQEEQTSFNNTHWYWVWDTGTSYHSVIAAHIRPLLSPLLDPNKLFSMINIYHSQRKFPIELFGFTNQGG